MPLPPPPKVHTYHCVCTSLLLATTHTLSSLPTRQPPALDKAIILPLPPPPSTSPEDEGDGNEQDTDMAEEGNAAPGGNKSLKQHKAPVLSDLGYTILLSMTTDSRPTIVRREDGFEKRYLQRCGRCRLVLGYELDDSHFPADAGSKVKILYVLPGGMMSTEVMAQGKKIGEAEVELGQRAMVGVWE